MLAIINSFNRFINHSHNREKQYVKINFYSEALQNLPHLSKFVNQISLHE